MPGFGEGIQGVLLGEKLRRQAERFGVKLLQAQEVVKVHGRDNYLCIDTADGNQYSACALLLAMGSRYRRLGVFEEENYIGAGIHYCATCNGPFYKRQAVVVVGGRNRAVEESLFRVRFVHRVTLLVPGGELKGSQVIREKARRHPQVNVRFHTESVGFQRHKGKLTGMTIRNNQTGATEEIHPAGVFIFIGQIPKPTFVKETGIFLDRWGVFPPAMIWFMRKKGPWVMKNINLPFWRPGSLVSLLLGMCGQEAPSR